MLSEALLILLALAAPVESANVAWPPVPGKAYPDLSLLDGSGNVVRLSRFKGKLILLEPIGMTCPACQAFVGAHLKGPLGKVVPQRDLESIAEYFPRYAGGIELSDPRIVHVQVLFYNMSMKAPSREDVALWGRHFAEGGPGNAVVLGATPDLLGPSTYDMIPGFQLIDKNFVLRVDSTGHRPRSDLYRELLPMVPRLLKE